MRINLNVPFAENAQAKALGARWDMARKTWYVENPPDVSPLMRWINGPEKKRDPNLKPSQFDAIARKRNGGAAKGGGRSKRDAYQAKMREGFPTPRSDYSLPDCGCIHVAPWDDCEHAFMAPDLDPDQADHIRSIMREA